VRLFRCRNRKKSVLSQLLQPALERDRVQKEGGTLCSDDAIRGRPAGGGLAPGHFLAAIGAVYLLGLASQMITAPVMLTRFGVWPFLAMQAVLTAAWTMLHVRRLRHAGRGIAPAQGIAIIHALAIVLLVLVGAFFIDNAPEEGWMPQSLLLLRQLVTLDRGAGDPLTILGLAACAALLLAPAFSLWAAAQPGRPA
jgi:hypothetical protein